MFLNFFKNLQLCFLNYSNLYWGWGAEDDDLFYRLKGSGLKVERPPNKIGRYKMMKHQKRKPQIWSKR